MKSARIITFLLALFLVVSPVKAFAADPAIGNEVLDTADATLTRSGAGTAGSPFKLQLNLNNANTWTATQTHNAAIILNNALTANGVMNLGDGGDPATISATTIKLTANGAGNDITANLVDNNTDALDVQQGSNNYINVSTIDGSENISFGNSLTNPTFSFLGSGSASFGGSVTASGNITTNGDVAVNGGDVTTTSSTGTVFNTTATTVNIAGAATSLTLGSTSGTASVRNATFSLPNATTVNATSATANFDSVNVGGGYGSTGTTMSSNGNVSSNGNITVDGSATVSGNTTVAGDVAVNGGDVTTTSSTGNLFNTTAITLNIGGAATSLSLGSGVGTTTVNGVLTVSGLLVADNGEVISTGQTLTANGASTFSPDSTNSVTVNTDSDSFLVLNGLTTATGEPLCIDASNNVVKCSSGFAAVAKSSGSEDLTATVKEQQKEIDQLKKEVEDLKALINK